MVTGIAVCISTDKSIVFDTILSFLKHTEKPFNTAIHQFESDVSVLWELQKVTAQN